METNKEVYPVSPEGYKRCSKCKEIKLLTEFYKDSHKKSGYDSQCKYCDSISHGYTPKVYRDDIPSGYKLCSSCSTIKPVTDFYKCAKEKDGLNYTCKACSSEWRKKYYAENIEKERERSRVGGKRLRAKYSAIQFEFGDTKVCTRCGEEKPYLEFNKNSGNKSGLSSYCKECISKHNKKAWKSGIISRDTRWRRAGINMTEELYDAILTQQEGVCAICGAVPNGIALSVDHDHETGKVRGLLCHQCNLMLGNAKDDMETLQKGIEYLERWKG